MFYQKLINTVYSFGAAVVIFGAWGKIEHKDFGDIALTAGLLTETTIFCIYGFMEWHEREERPEPQRGKLRPTQETNEVVEVDELTATIRQTNRILNKVFKAD